MGKASRRKQTRRTQPVTGIRFDEPSEWGTLRLAEEHAPLWLTGAADILEGPVWRELVALQGPFVQEIRQYPWPERPVDQLVRDLHVAGNIRDGIDHFLPPSYRHWPLDLRRAIYLTNFLIHGLAAIEGNPTEDFGLPQFAHWPAQARAVLSAARPLWYMIATTPAIAATITKYHRSHHIGVDGALLTLLHEAGPAADTLWRPIIEERPGELLSRIGKAFRNKDLNTDIGQPAGNTLSQAFFTARRLQGEKSAADTLADAMAGQFDHFHTVVKRGLIDHHRKESIHEKYTSRNERLEVILRHQEDPEA
jgi:hypothetical protein